MPSMKEIKRRVSSVKNTEQIMKAMNLVAASKLQKNKNRLEGSVTLFNRSKDFVEQTPYYEDAESTVFYRNLPNSKSAFIVIAGEKGLCGGYNTNILKKAYEAMQDKDEQIIAIGAKCRDYLARRRKKIVTEYVGVLEEVNYRLAQDIAEGMCARFASNLVEENISELYIAYTRFESVLTHVPTVTKILPLENGKGSMKREELIFEPDLELYLLKSVPVFVTMFLYGAMLESSVCEQASRMTSMDAAARNAGEILEDLTLQYNRQRQSAITQEISEIVGGANAI